MKDFTKYRENTEAVAAIEAALLFPVLLLLLLGMLDVGYGILANQKAIRASQVTADLLARKPDVTTTDIYEAIEAGKLALQPFDTSTFGVDAVSIYFDDDGNSLICWRETYNTSPNDTVLSSTDGLGAPGEGILAVTVNYDYVPGFSSNLFQSIEMQEVAYVRGRKSAIIQRSGACM
jgi:Flp pilus assembly protein TadG